MTIYRKSFPEGTSSLVRELIDESKDPNILKRAQAIYCRAAYNMPPDQIAGITGLAESTVRRLHSDFQRFGMEIFNMSGRGGRRNEIMRPEEEEAFLQDFAERSDAGGILEVARVHSALCERAQRCVHISATYKLLRRNGWRKIAPRPQHPKGDKAAQAAFKKMA